MNFDKYGLFPFGAVPNSRQYRHLHYKKAFFHFGVNTFTSLEWGNGTESEKSFNPSELDIDQWMRVIKNAGFDLALITAKHHDGFCLWPSAYTEHSVKNSPYKNGKGDIIREFTDSARKYGIKAGIYISPWDRNSEYWGKAEYSDFYAKQLKELMTGYGEISEVWWDGAGSTETVYDWGRWASIIREFQPSAAIFGSLGASEYVDLRWVGNESGYAGETHYASIKTHSLVVEDRGELNTGIIGAERYIPAEVDVSIRPGWFYHKDQDDKVKSVSALNRIWFDSIGRGAMLLLNFPPDRRGLVHETDARNALLSYRCISRMLSVNYAAGANISADSVLDDCIPENAVIDNEDIFYAASADKTTAVIDIVLTQAENINVFAVGEEVRLGERITEFTVESVTDNGTDLLYSGKSIGFFRAVRLPEGMYRHIRFTIKNALASPVINKLGLYRFDESAETSEETDASFNLCETPSSKIEISDDRRSATINFGGIFPFDCVRFGISRPDEYKIYAFSGTEWYEIFSGKAESTDVRIKLREKINGSYQIKLCTASPIAKTPGFDVR